MRRGMGLVIGMGMDIEAVMDREEGEHACIIVMKGRMGVWRYKGGVG